MHVFCIFVLAPVQRNLACVIWKGTLEIHSFIIIIIIVIIIIIIIIMSCHQLLAERL